MADVQLPPLPPPTRRQGQQMSYDGCDTVFFDAFGPLQMQEYATAAVLADRAARCVTPTPAGWRFKSKEGGEWHFDGTLPTGHVFDVEPLYACGVQETAKPGMTPRVRHRWNEQTQEWEGYFAAGVALDARPSRAHAELMLLAAADLESWMKSYHRDGATEDTVKRLREAALSDGVEGRKP